MQMGTYECNFLLFAVVHSMACGPILLYLQYAFCSFILRFGFSYTTETEKTDVADINIRVRLIIA